MIGQFINAFFTRRGGNGDNGGKYYGLVKLAKCSVKRVACKLRPNWRNCVPQICKCRRDVKLFGRVVGTKKYSFLYDPRAKGHLWRKWTECKIVSKINAWHGQVGKRGVK